MSKRKCLTISTVMTIIIACLCAVVTLIAALGGSDEPDLAEGLGRALIMIFGIFALMYLGATLLLKITDIAFCKNFLTFFVMLFDLVGVVAVIAVIVSAVIEPNFELTKQFIIDALPLAGLAVLQFVAVIFDFKSFGAL